eukprot:3658454-Amphidinium_carterae.1
MAWIKISMEWPCTNECLSRFPPTPTKITQAHQISDRPAQQHVNHLTHDSLRHSTVKVQEAVWQDVGLNP